MANAAPPVTKAGVGLRGVKDSLLWSTVYLDGSGSFDPEGNAYAARWYGPFGSAAGVSPAVTIPRGVYTVLLQIMGCPQSAGTDTVEVTVIPAFTLSARSKRCKVQLTWDHLAEAVRYHVYRSDESDPYTFEKIAETTSAHSTYRDFAVVNETNYLYAIAAIAADDGAQFSNIVAACPPASRAKARMNRPPMLYSPPVTTATRQTPYDYTLMAADANLDTLSYNLSSAPAGMVIDAATGRIQWTPEETGTFHVIASTTDPGGLEDAQSFSIAVIAPAPSVTFSADPEAIVSGQQSATLSWCATQADYAVIDPGVGEVAPAGSLQVAPAQNTTYTITAFSPGGSATATAAVQVSSESLAVQIASPTQAQHFTTDRITVTGKVNRSDASVFVNGAAATVSGGEFTAPNIPLVPGVNTISVMAEAGDDTAVAGTSVWLDTTVDLEPLRLEIPSWESDASLKVTGQVMVTVANNGSSAVDTTYRIVAYEDLNLSGSYEENQDNRLGETEVAAGPGPGEAMEVGIDFAGQLQFRDNRLHVQVDGAGEVIESDEANNRIVSLAGGADLSASLLAADGTACPDEISLGVRIGNAGDLNLPAGIPVAFYDGEPADGGILIGTAATTQALEPGQHQELTLNWPHPPTGMRLVFVMVDDDGTGAGAVTEVDEANNGIFCEVTICAAPIAQPNGMSGQVFDAVTGDSLPGATVSLHAAENGVAGALVLRTETDEFGGYIFEDLAPGDYYLIAEKAGYITLEQPVTLAMVQALDRQDLVLSPALDSEETRIVLTWGEAPADLEAHLTAPNPDGCRYHLFYWEKNVPGASLDLDDRESYGPETITISQRAAGTYRFYVHDFINRNAPAGTSLANSGATVTVYSGSVDGPRVFSVPAQPGSVWHVFNLDGASGAITPIDKMTDQAQPGRIDFPRITSNPVTAAAYGETYTYRVEAEDPDQDPLAYSLVKGPEGMHLDPFTGLVQWTPSAGQGQWQDVELRVNDGRCGEDTQTFPIHLTYRPMVQFTVSPVSGMNPGGEITLTWQTERADSVVIDQGIGEVSPSGSISIPSPAEPTVFTLTAANGAGQVGRTVPGPPSISTVSASCAASAGETATLEWLTTGAVNCQIDQGAGSVPAQGSLAMTPTQLPQFYTLTCSNAGGSVYAKTSVAECRPTVSLTENTDCNWSPGDPVTLEWSTTGARDCTIDPEVGSVPLNGSVQVWPTEVPARYTLACNVAFDSVEIKNPQTLEFNATTDALLPGQSAGLFWNTTCVDTCSLDQGIGEVAANGSVAVTPAQLPTTYTLTATGVDGTSLTKSVTIRLVAPSASFGASPALIKAGETATLTWTSERATSCRIQPNIGEVPLNGSINVSPAQNTKYVLTATGPGGNTTRTAAVTYVEPMAAIYADPPTLDTIGQTTTLTWVFSNADTCVIDQGIGEVQLGGSIKVSPPRTTTYTITATGPGGVATSEVTVAYPLPQVTFSADRDTLDEGETATLTWSASNADTCTINRGIGEVPPAGSIVVDPDQTTTYAITATGSGGTTIGLVTVSCIAPTASIQAEPGTIMEGQAIILSWQTDHATTAAIEPNIGQVAGTGSLALGPGVTTTYTITAAGRGGETRAATTVTVINPPSVDLIEPDGDQDKASTSYTVRWTDRDPDSDALISLYYDTDACGADGTLIVTGLAENGDGLADQYLWDTSNVPSGNYYVYALIDDGFNDPVVDYSEGTITIDHTVADEIKLTASDGAPYDGFGRAVSIDGDYAVVGAPDHDGGGAAYIYRQEGSAWREGAILTAGASVTDYFGTSVFISSDTAVVGAPNENDGQGAAYLFTRDEAAWTQEARLTAPDGLPWAHFGDCVALSGDTLLVGAPGHDEDAGAVYVYTRQDADWGTPTLLTPSSGDPAGLFGASLAIDQDALIVGSPSADNQTGAALIYRRIGSQWVEEARLLAGDGASLSGFGNAVSISDNTVIVGNRGQDETGVEGAAYIFVHDGAAWVAQAKIGANEIGAGVSFGRSVAINGDWAVVGEPKILDGAGAAYLFKRTGDQWMTQSASTPPEGEGEAPAGEGEGESEIPSDEAGTSGAFQKLTPSDGQPQDYFGTCLDLDDEHLIVGARLDDDKGYDSGSAYLYPLFSASIAADPAQIQLGGEGAFATLTWSSRGADSVRIDPQIGSVDPSGSMTITPQQTTTYVITAFKGGARVTDSVTVAVIDTTAVPTLTLTAAPETIVRGGSATLAWSATSAASVTLDHQIATLPMSGDMAVAPSQTTTYTATATNAAGTATASATITVTDPPPVVEMTVEPAQILKGDSATLTWNTTYADTVAIDQEIGTVSEADIRVVDPVQTTTYTITATGSGGTTTASATLTVANPITLEISEPAEGVFISGTSVSVRGTLSHANGLETGLMVNGVPVIIDGGAFIANHVPLAQGENTLTATATDTDGVIFSHAVTVTAQYPASGIRLSASPVSGTPPFETTLRIDSHFPIATAQFYYEGPGEVTFLDQTVDEAQVEITASGLYTFSVEADDQDGATHTASVSVEVVDEEALDTLLQAKWAGMKAALMGGDVQGALAYHHEAARERYGAIYDALGDELATLVGQMQDISPIYLDGALAKYRILQDHDVSGQTVTITYYIYFSKNEDGIWKIEKY